MGLIENTSQCSHRHFVFFGHDGGIDHIANPPYEFYVATLLAGFNETRRRKPSLDLSKGPLAFS